MNCNLIARRLVLVNSLGKPDSLYEFCMFVKMKRNCYLPQTRTIDEQDMKLYAVFWFTNLRHVRSAASFKMTKTVCT